MITGVKAIERITVYNLTEQQQWALETLAAMTRDLAEITRKQKKKIEQLLEIIAKREAERIKGLLKIDDLFVESEEYPGMLVPNYEHQTIKKEISDDNSKLGRRIRQYMIEGYLPKLVDEIKENSELYWLEEYQRTIATLAFSEMIKPKEHYEHHKGIGEPLFLAGINKVDEQTINELFINQLRKGSFYSINPWYHRPTKDDNGERHYSTGVILKPEQLGKIIPQLVGVDKAHFDNYKNIIK